MSSATYDMLVVKMTENLGVDASRICPDATFLELELDSLAAMELGVILEEDLGVTFDLDELKGEEMTFDQFSRYVERLVAEKQSAAVETA
ncbi:acyl carrier protein [Streptomyces sp. ISL-112]|uniref:acyl carrier protein n=1 Tax=unclassified Streptomyces TaxID=2593676 RepID=UPI001BE64C55|nr:MULTISPECIES: acyl carrier protein [unclassified Streptomyces]MBT2427480.1 acyl carrier protein [Streptomyces sp. ISL-112]MBT2464515.1 acyl carrier protein [Streptomyces sp. ISL-63]